MIIQHFGLPLNESHAASAEKSSTIAAVIKSLNIIYASTSGNTEYVVGVIVDRIKAKAANLKVAVKKAECAESADLLKGDVLLLASGSWNTGGIEGQMNPYMHALLQGKAKDIDLKNKKTAIIALGDDRYYYTCRSGEHMRTFTKSHNGTIFGDPLLVVNDPYGQEERINKWTDKFLVTLRQAS